MTQLQEVYCEYLTMSAMFVEERNTLCIGYTVLHSSYICIHIHIYKSPLAHM